MRKRILGVVPIIVTVVLVLLIGGGVAMGAGSGPTVYTYPISSGNLNVLEPFLISGSLDPLLQENFFPGQPVTSGAYVIDNPSPVAYGIWIEARNDNTRWPVPVLAVRAEVIRMAAPTEMIQPGQVWTISPGESVTVIPHVFVAYTSCVGKVVSPTLIFNRVEPLGERG